MMSQRRPHVVHSFIACESNYHVIGSVEIATVTAVAAITHCAAVPHTDPHSASEILQSRRGA
jgi:hypothetical protein